MHYGSRRVHPSQFQNMQLGSAEKLVHQLRNEVMSWEPSSATVSYSQLETEPNRTRTDSAVDSYLSHAVPLGLQDQTIQKLG